MMHKSLSLLAALFVFAAIVSPVWGVSQAPDKGLNSKGKAEHLYLLQKDPADWTIVENGAWGKLTYLAGSGKFIFNGHNLTPGADYALIYYPDPWPGMNLAVFGNSTSDEYGDVHIAGTFDFTTIPNEGDLNYPEAKIWLVLTADQDGTKMTGWNPTEYLFEYAMVTF
jgi:hypothetical protein